MMPCSSGNSPTMSVSRSALASSAAAPSAEVELVRASAVAAELRADGARDRAHALDALALACRACRGRPPWPGRHARLAASSCGPGRRRTWRRPGAGAPRARCRSITRARVGGADVADDQEAVASAGPSASSSGKYFWLAFIVRIRHSCGTARNSASKRHSSTFGRSTSAVTSSSSASSSIGVRPCRAPRRAASWRTISARRAAKLAITAPCSSSWRS